MPPRGPDCEECALYATQRPGRLPHTKHHKILIDLHSKLKGRVRTSLKVRAGDEDRRRGH